MKFIDAIGLKYFYDKLKDKFVQRIVYNKKTSADDTTHTDIERAIETPLIIGGKKNGSSNNTNLVLQDGNSSFEDGTGNYISIGGENIYIDSDNVNIGNGLLIVDKTNSNGASVNIESEDIKIWSDKINIESDNSSILMGSNQYGDDGITFKSPNTYTFEVNNTDCKMYFNQRGGTINNGNTVDTLDDGLKINYKTVVTYNFSSTEARLLKDVITASKTQIRNRISSTCSTKLTEAKGFQVFTNLYADPEHCTDIADYTDTEKAILTNNTVQKNILELNKTKTFVDSIKVNDNSIKLSEKNTTTNISYENYINPTGIFFRTITTMGSLGTRVNTLLKINNNGIVLYNGSATKVFATNGETFDMNTKADAFTEIPLSSWKTSTPFNILDGVVTNIYKGETVGNYTKWILIPYADSENQKYTAYKKGNAKYIYSQYDFDPNQPLLPWEFWLPSNLTSGTVEVDW